MTDWDAYWRAVIADPQRLARERCSGSASAFFHFVDWLPREEWKRVLVVGCGVSTEMRAMSAVGYEVLAIDVSGVAIEHLQTTRYLRAEVAWWFQRRRDPTSDLNVYLSPEEALAKLEGFRRDGGSLEVRCCDFREVSETSFDIVYCPWSWHCLDDEARRELPRACAKWLVPGGAVRIATYNMTAEGAAELEAAFATVGIQYAGHDALVRLAAGDRLYDVYNFSG